MYPDEPQREVFEDRYGKWKRFVANGATSLSSSDVDYVSNPEFEAIVDMGEVAIPFITEKLRTDDSAHFLIHALKKITDERFARKEIDAGQHRHGAALGNQGFAAMEEEWWSRQRGSNE